MDMLVKTIFESIEANEQKAAMMYRALIKKLDDQDVKKMLQSLLDDELRHDSFFEDFDEMKLADINKKDLEKIKAKLGEEFDDVDTDKDTLVKILDKAIKDEEIARSCYETMAQNLDGKARDDLLTLAGHEKHHKEILELIKAKCC